MSEFGNIALMHDSRCTSCLHNQRGQSAIFVALIFQVLFVFFAMMINVAMVVSDKVNLQNSVDLAAYYAAQRQAEWLNVIAHTNYQIRQSWKLLSWRYRVLGGLGLEPPTAHPAWTDTRDERQFYAPVTSNAASRYHPIVCVTFSRFWKNAPPKQNLCKKAEIAIPALPQVETIADFVPLNHLITALSTRLRIEYQADCRNHGQINWWFANLILHSFRLDQRHRKILIEEYAKVLNNPNDFKDIYGSSVRTGARKTFSKNLTPENYGSDGENIEEFQLLNSLGGLDREDWLREILILPTLQYMDTLISEGCNSQQKPHWRPPNHGFPQFPFTSVLKTWSQQVGLDALTEKSYNFSMGFEKNPWVMAYVGVKATTKPRPIFFPMGPSITMRARAFAKPFGGRMGPWGNIQWPKSSDRSIGDILDKNMPPRLNENGFGGTPTESEYLRTLANYSRFPGDLSGLTTYMGLNSAQPYWKYGPANYADFHSAIFSTDKAFLHDPLTWSEKGPAPTRKLELAAVAPDLWDVTYYSIEPNFDANYLGHIRAHKQSIGISSSVPLRGDLGERRLNNAQPIYSVQEQMRLANEEKLHHQDVFFFIRKKEHLLTAWLPGRGVSNYTQSGSPSSFPEWFGKCTVTDDDKTPKNPGSCIAGGGRTGYSVKLISREALFSNEYELGGPSVPSDSIKNPPPKGW